MCLGIFIAAGILAYNLVQPDVKPCPDNSPRILPPAVVASTLDLLLDECTSVIGEVTGKDSEGLIIAVDRGDYRQTVKVIFPEDRRSAIPLRREVHITGRIREHEEWVYAVHFGEDLGWWDNLRKNLPGDVFDP